MAYDVATGEVRWAAEGFTPGYASPIIVDIEGTRQLVTQSDKHIIGVDAESGELLWTIPFATPWQQNVVTPVSVGSRLIFSGLQRGLFAIDMARRREGAQSWVATEVWRNDLLPMFLSSPVVVGDRVFGITHRNKGQFFCADVRTGELMWTSRGRQAESAAVVAIGDRIVFLTDAAEMIIIDARADEYEPLAWYEVANQPTWAHPVFTSLGVLIKDHNTLAHWRF